MPATIPTPVLLVGPGILWMAPVGTAVPTNTVTASKFSDTLAAAWLLLGATDDGSTFQSQTEVQAISVAEFFDPITWATTSRTTTFAFAMSSFGMSNMNRAVNGGVAALTPVGTSGSELTTLNPPTPGNEVRCALFWESTDSTVRLMIRQAIQGGQMSSDFKKAPNNSLIPCTFNAEVPSSGQPWTMWGAGLSRV